METEKPTSGEPRKTGVLEQEELRALLTVARDAQAATERQDSEVPPAVETRPVVVMNWGRNFALAALGFAGALFLIYAGIAIVIAAAKIGG